MIAAVKEASKVVWAYNENGRPLFGKSGTLVGYTCKTISVKSNAGTIWTYDESGRVLFGK